MSDPLRQELLDIFVGRATKRYGLSAINQLQHALQAAAHAEAEDAPAATVLASLLHDVGHMIHQLGEDPAACAATTRRPRTRALERRTSTTTCATSQPAVSDHDRPQRRRGRLEPNPIA